MYEFFSHTADLGLRVRAATLDELFADAARGLVRMLVANPEAVECVDERTFSLQSDNIEYLLFDWLSELLYLFETSAWLPGQVAVSVQANRLEATCRGEAVDRDRHNLEHEVKAITYHNLRVEQENGAWIAELIVDI